MALTELDIYPEAEENLQAAADMFEQLMAGTFYERHEAAVRELSTRPSNITERISSGDLRPMPWRTNE